MKEIWAEYVRSSTITTKIVPGNRNAKDGVILDCRYVTLAVQEFVRERRITRTRTVAKDIMDFLASRSLLYVDRSSEKSVKAGLRAVQRFLVAKGYERGKKKGAKNYRLKEHIAVMRDKYVLRMTEENDKKTRRIVYMDESYIHKNYCRHEDSLYDPNDEQDLTTVAHHKGQRYCFIAAIVDADHSIPEELRTPEQKAGLLRETLDIFEGGKKQTKDYHGMFDHEYFVGWMKKLLLSLKERNISNAIIIMDNAKYHKKLSNDVPRKSQKKADLQQACERYGIAFRPTDTKVMLWENLRQYIQANIPPVIVQMAQEEGHEVLYSPPHYSDLQPIETVWAVVKGDVGRQYSTETTFKDVLERLKRAFHTLQSHTVQGCINKSNRKLKELCQQLTHLEDMDDEEEDDEMGSDEQESEEESDSHDSD